LAFSPTGCRKTAGLLNPNVTSTPPPAGTAFTQGPGQTLTNIHVQLIFWGAWWNSTTLAGRVTNAVTSLLAGPYMTYLAQYGVHRGNVRGTTFANDSEPGPSFSFASVGAFIQSLLDQDRLPEPDDEWPIIYAVIMPLNSAFQGVSPQDKLLPTGGLPPGVKSIVNGENGQIVWNDYDLGDVDNDPAYYLWVGNDGTPDYITTVLSHELVELATDPNGGNGVRQTAPPSQAGQGQIGDVANVCQVWCDYVRGVKAQGYWSIADGTGVLPTLYSVRRTLAGKSLGGKLPRPMPSANSWITAQF
jgi:hypothetical protein